MEIVKFSSLAVDTRKIEGREIAVMVRRDGRFLPVREVREAVENRLNTLWGGAERRKRSKVKLGARPTEKQLENGKYQHIDKTGGSLRLSADEPLVLLEAFASEVEGMSDRFGSEWLITVRPPESVVRHLDGFILGLGGWLEPEKKPEPKP